MNRYFALQLSVVFGALKCVLIYLIYFLQHHKERKAELSTVDYQFFKPFSLTWSKREICVYLHLICFASGFSSSNHTCNRDTSCHKGLKTSSGFMSDWFFLHSCRCGVWTPVQSTPSPVVSGGHTLYWRTRHLKPFAGGKSKVEREAERERGG